MIKESQLSILFYLLPMPLYPDKCFLFVMFKTPFFFFSYIFCFVILLLPYSRLTQPLLPFSLYACSKRLPDYQFSPNEIFPQVLLVPFTSSSFFFCVVFGLFFFFSSFFFFQGVGLFWGIFFVCLFVFIFCFFLVLI